MNGKAAAKMPESVKKENEEKLVLYNEEIEAYKQSIHEMEKLL